MLWKLSIDRPKNFKSTSRFTSPSLWITCCSCPCVCSTCVDFFCRLDFVYMYIYWVFFFFFFICSFSFFLFCIFFLILISLFIVVIICYLHLPWNFCYGICTFYLSLSVWVCLLGFVYLDLSSSMCHGSKCILYNVKINSNSNRRRFLQLKQVWCRISFPVVT